MPIIRSLARRRLRTSLTLLGVAIAVFGLVVLGALSERMRLHIENSERYFSAYAWVFGKASFFGLGGQLDASLRQRIDAIPGVDHAASRVFLPMSADEMLSANFWEMSVLVGIDLEEGRCILREMRLLSGRQMPPGAHGEAILGYAAAQRYHKKVGDTITAQGHPLEVVGILDLIGSDPDDAVFTSVDDAREIAHLPPDEVSLYAVRIKPGADETAVKRAVEAIEPGRLAAVMPSQVHRAVASTAALFNALFTSCGVVAVVLGTLGVANTMMMSVAERAREIATKKAIGAATRDVFLEFLVEALTLSAVGAVLGVLLGCLGVAVLNRVIEAHGLPIFVITPRLVALALVVTVVVGSLAGVFPALQAAKTDPVRILRNV